MGLFSVSLLVGVVLHVGPIAGLDVVDVGLALHLLPPPLSVELDAPAVRERESQFRPVGDLAG
jgi:hypothetical protein